MIEGDTIYCGENCNHTGPHRYRPGPGVAEVIELMHRHIWVFDAADPTGITYHCDAHDPSWVRRVPHSATWPAS